MPPLPSVKLMYVDVTQGMRGFFAVMLWWNPEMGGFWEPWESSSLSFASRERAEVDGRRWAGEAGVPYGQAPEVPTQETC